MTERACELLGAQVVTAGDDTKRYKDHEKRGAAQRGGVPGAGGVGVRVLRVEKPPTVSSGHPPRVVD